MRYIISLSGVSQSGKDSIGDVLVSQFGFAKISFARNLKNLCQDIFHLTPKQTDTQEGKAEVLSTPITLTASHFELILQWMYKTHNILADEYRSKVDALEELYVNKIQFKTPRELLQIVGTEIIRGIYEPYHVEVLENVIKAYPNHNFVAVDSRYPNERTMLKSHGARLVLVNRPALQSKDAHISELSLGNPEDYDMIVNNKGSLIELQKKVRKLVRPLYLVGATI